MKDFAALKVRLYVDPTSSQLTICTTQCKWPYGPFV